jgi:hypothetical protein
MLPIYLKEKFLHHREISQALLLKLAARAAAPTAERATPAVHSHGK